MSPDDLRRPTDEEQAVIAATYEAMTRLSDRLPKLAVVGVGMGKGLIEDDRRGRWVSLFGKPVVQIGGGDWSDDRALVLLVKVDPAEAPDTDRAGGRG